METTTQYTMHSGILQHNKALKAIKAGKAIVTFRNKNTGNRFTYKVRKCRDKELYFVSVLTGPDNTRDYRYIGSIFDNDFRVTKKSKLSPTATSVRGFMWVNSHLNNNTLPENFEVWHEGHCCRCGKRLTVPESIESGFGPECIKLMNC